MTEVPTGKGASEPDEVLNSDLVKKGSRSFFRRVLRRVLVSLVLAAAFAWVLQRGGLPFAPPEGSTRELRWWAVPSFVGLMLVAFYFRTVRWIHMLKPFADDISPRGTFAVGLVGSGATFFAPLRLGEMVRPYLLSTTIPQVRFAQALGTVAAERAIDGLVIVLMTSLGLWLSDPVSPLPQRVGQLPIPVSLVPDALRSAAALFVVVLAGLVMLYLMQNRVSLLLSRTVGRVAPKFATALSENLARLAQGLLFAGRSNTAWPFMTYTALYWLLSAAANWALLRGINLEASFAQACVCLGLIGLGSLLPAGPGFFGAYQVASYTALAMYYSMASVTFQGALYVFASYVSHVGLNGATCILGLMLLPRRPAPAR